LSHQVQALPSPCATSGPRLISGVRAAPSSLEPSDLPDPAATQLAMAIMFAELVEHLRWDDAAARLLVDLNRREGGSRPQPIPATPHPPDDQWRRQRPLRKRRGSITLSLARRGANIRPLIAGGGIRWDCRHPYDRS
jgi:hypothetical protein